MREPGPDLPGDDARLASLDRRLRDAQAGEARRADPGEATATADYNLGNRVLAELLGGLIGGALIGWTIDRFAGTSPWGLLVLLSLGIVVAFRNIYRISRRPK